MNSKLRNLSFFLVTTIAFWAVRLTTYPNVYKYDFLNLIDPDSYYHLRRVKYTLNNYPSMLNFDPFLSYPHGDYSPWPFFYDFFSASVIKLFGSNTDLIPYLNPLYFFIAFTIIYLIFLRYYGLSAAVISSIFLALSGILYVYTSFGRFDHHAMEFLLIILSYLSFLSYFYKKNLSALILFTLFLGLSFYNWAGALIYYPPMILFIAYNFWKDQVDTKILKGLFIAFHVVAISLALYLRITKTAHFPPYSYKFLSGFHRDLCFLISVLFITLYFHKTLKIKKIIIWIVNLLVCLILFNKLFFEFFNGIKFILKTEKLMILVEESSPLFFGKFYSLKEELIRALSLFTPFLFLSPFIFYSYFKKNKSDLLFIYTLYFFLLMFFQLRFGYFFMIGYSLMLGIVFKEFLQDKIRYVLLAFCAMAIIIFLRDYKLSGERFISNDLAKGLVFLRDQTSYKKDFENNQTPYGVLASWHLGHYIIEIANRPAVAHNFINVALNNGEKEFIKAAFSEKEAQILEIMNKNKSRFLFLDYIDDLIVTDWHAISSGKNPYSDDNKKPNQKVFNLYLYRLYHYDGIVPPFDNSPGALRLVYESSSLPNRIKVFEHVRGARVIYSGKETPVLKAKIKTPYREFFYIHSGKTFNSKKEYTIPYSIDKVYPVKAEQIYLEIGGKKTDLKISEQDIITGNTIHIN